MTEPTLEMTRLRELRKASQDLIELMVADGWLEADSHGIALLEEGWLTLWREYTDRFEALEGADAKNDLFGKHTYYIGQVFPIGSTLNTLNVGDCIECRRFKYKVSTSTNKHFIWVNDAGVFSIEWDKFQKVDAECTYLGNNIW